MLPISVLCNIVESGFEPLSCECTESLGLLRIEVFDPVTGRVELLISGVSTAELTSVRAISDFIGELRTEMKAGRRAFAG
ncbi:Protein of unknown function (DUF1652) [Pseudomonas sp. GM33]|jgi:hypothetical protein|uniref:DUF1652 domain-containing protein n=1 Tax=unclassified Pseudomonas TaxID=196821 RepID=UPI0002700B0E|nr:MULTISPECIES: DUF1652 domain-containing protein [unclassified Pseudomonas]EJM36394.1 Protein of unknown function (DUF1652) [Pseudomonas sp. GM33]MBV7574803.1 DUF1652 domain-containing protein [Pseudomonas sp. PDM32]MDP9656424.1 hypothetical protein [Pseudomonas putida]PVZ54205.1 DUF1652 domain-containing protein [Pseudomonas sp. B1(2018)]